LEKESGYERSCHKVARGSLICKDVSIDQRVLDLGKAESFTDRLTQIRPSAVKIMKKTWFSTAAFDKITAAFGKISGFPFKNNLFRSRTLDEVEAYNITEGHNIIQSMKAFGRIDDIDVNGNLIARCDGSQKWGTNFYANIPRAKKGCHLFWWWDISIKNGSLFL
jgi:hypothetical protein